MKHADSYKVALRGLLKSMQGELLSADELVELINAQMLPGLQIVRIFRELTPEETEIIHLDISCVAAFSKAAHLLTALDTPGPADVVWGMFLKAVGKVLGKASSAISADAFAEAVRLGLLEQQLPLFVAPVVHKDALCFAVVRLPANIQHGDPVVVTGASPDFDLSKWRVDKSKMN